MKSSDTVKFTNLVEKSNINHYYGHGNTNTTQLSSKSFHQGMEDWELRGLMCLNFGEHTVLHVETTINQGNNLEVVGIKMKCVPCPYHSNNVNLPSQIQDMRMELILLDGDTEFKKQITMNVGDTWVEFITSNDFFLPMEIFRAVCKQGKDPRSGTNEIFEYVEGRLNTEIVTYSPNFVTTTHCRSAFLQGKHGIEITQDNSLYPDIDNETETIVKTFSEGIVEFKVGCDDATESIFIHKALLTNNSKVFTKMLESEMQERTSKIVRLPEVNAETMAAFAQCLYANKFPTSLAINLEVLKLAHKYQMDDIIRGATKAVVMTDELMDLWLALNMFAVGNRFEIPDLEFRAMQWLKSNKDSASSTDGKEIINDFMLDKMDLLPTFLGWLL